MNMEERLRVLELATANMNPEEKRRFAAAYEDYATRKAAIASQKSRKAGFKPIDLMAALSHLGRGM